MITLNQVSKIYSTRQGNRTVLDQINLQIKPSQKVGILGRNGSGKSTLIRLISGAERPSSGTIQRTMSVSWPLAFTDAFNEKQTGLDCLRFVCRIYGINKEDIKEKLEFVKEFTELGSYLHEPIKSYSSGMRARLAFAVSMAIEFDCFLIDEIISVGDSRFHEKCYIELFEKRKDRALIIVSHDPGYIKAHCDSAAVLVEGKLHTFDKIDEAYEFYQAITQIKTLHAKSIISCGLEAKDVISAYRFLLGRDPESEDIIERLQVVADWQTLRELIISCDEFRQKITPIINTEV